jgi:hypothetical protein
MSVLTLPTALGYNGWRSEDLTVLSGEELGTLLTIPRYSTLINQCQCFLMYMQPYTKIAGDVEALPGREPICLMINTCAWTHVVGYVVVQVGIIALTGVVSHELLGARLSSTREHLYPTVHLTIAIL